MDKLNDFSEKLTNEEKAWLNFQLNDEIIDHERLKKGNTNNVFLLHASNKNKYIFKRLNCLLMTEMDRFHEVKVHKLASDHQLSSKIIASNNKFQLQEFIEGRELTEDWPIEILAKQLDLIHQLPAKFASKQSLALDLEFLYKKLLSRNIKIDKDRATKMYDLALTLDKKSPLDTLSHGDLSFSNLISKQLTPNLDAKIKIIDWEYSRLASPAYDLAASITINKLNIEESEQLLVHYCSLQKEGDRVFDKIKIDLKEYLSIFSYLNKLWMIEVDI